MAEKTVVACNFRAAGRLSNDSTRHLRTVHEGFARNLSHSLDMYLGTSVEVKVEGVEQIGVRDLLSGAGAAGYMVPMAITPLSGRVVTRLDGSLMFPLLDLLLGGTGDTDEQSRELTELDEELIRSVTELMASQLERAWKGCAAALTVQPSVKPQMLAQLLATEETLVVVHLEMTVVATTGGLDLLLPMAFANALIRASQTEATRRVSSKAKVARRLRDRVLDCVMTTSTELRELRLSVGDLVGLEAGDVIDLHAPVSTPVKLFIGGHELFEVVPVRHGTRKTAQLGRQCGEGERR